jgi:hypothetical protein
VELVGVGDSWKVGNILTELAIDFPSSGEKIQRESSRFWGFADDVESVVQETSVSNRLPAAIPSPPYVCLVV